MQFNSVEYFLFLIPVFTCYWWFNQKSLNLRNALIVIVSYTFYAFWDWRFLSLLIISSFSDYFIGRLFERKPNRKKILLFASMVINLGILGFFKYYDFFVDSFVAAFQEFGIHLHVETLRIILPVGISFYTFQTMSYTIDIYRGNLKPTKNIFAFFAFVSFFPQLVAGPIERASKLLPQFEKRVAFNNDFAKSGLRLILWGLLQKVVLADMCAREANYIFANYAELDGGTLLLGSFFFAFQIYGDFAGYSNIAIGTARLFGINLMKNFNIPYIAVNLEDFWRRWHISLSSWFRDYLYIPLGGSRNKLSRTLINISIVFIVSGFWHGAKWTFILWGTWHALFYIPVILRKRLFKKDKENSGNRAVSIIYWGLTFFIVCIGWVFFRAENVTIAFDYIGRILSDPLSSPGDPGITKLPVLIAGLFFLVEFIFRKKESPLDSLFALPRALRWTTYYVLILLMVFIGSEPQTFIYFQF